MCAWDRTSKSSIPKPMRRRITWWVRTRLIRDAGWIPAQRDQYYNVLQRHDGPDSPDLVPVTNPPVRNVRRIDKQFIGAAPGLDDGADTNVKVQLPILGDAR